MQLFVVPVSSHQQRGHLMQSIEYAHQLYRCTIAPMLWVQYVRIATMYMSQPQLYNSMLHFMQYTLIGVYYAWKLRS